MATFGSTRPCGASPSPPLPSCRACGSSAGRRARAWTSTGRMTRRRTNKCRTRCSPVMDEPGATNDRTGASDGVPDLTDSVPRVAGAAPDAADGATTGGEGPADGGDGATKAVVKWEEWLDGCPRRLKRGKHYTGDPKAVVRRAREAASELGKLAISSVDSQGKYEYLWIQFVD